MSELKACPFCGEEAAYFAPSVVGCTKCQATVGTYGIPANTAWNRRTPDAALARVKALEDAARAVRNGRGIPPNSILDALYALLDKEA